MSERFYPPVTYAAAPTRVTANGAAGTAATAPARGDHSHALGIVTTRGDIIVRDAASPVRLALGGINTVLQSNGTDLVYDSAPPPTFISIAKYFIN